MLKKVFISIAISSLIMACTIPAFAFNLWGPKLSFYYSNVVTYNSGNLSGFSSSYTTAFNSALSSWNSSQSDVQWGSLSSGDVTLNVYHVANSSEYGRCQSSYTGGQWTPFSELNQYTLSSLGPSIKQSTACHELGHALGLYENTGVSYPSVMDQNRSRVSIYTPQSDDISGVKYIY